MLARALWDSKRDRARAAKLVDEANPLIEHPTKRAELERWVADVMGRALTPGR